MMENANGLKLTTPSDRELALMRIFNAKLAVLG